MFALSEVTFLGNRLGKHGFSPSQEHVRAIIDMPAPKTKREAMSVHGMFSFQRKFIQNFSQIVAPITKLFKQETAFEWGAEQQAAFDELKFKITRAPVLAYYDLQRETQLRTDASGIGLGAVLL